MDQGLFTKHILRIQQQQDSKQEVLDYIKITTGVTLTNTEITITKKTIHFSVSSVKRGLLIQKNIKNILLEKGYFLK
jgi:hypothetical protein